MELNKTFTAKVLKSGKITIPVEIRELHKIDENDTVTIVIHEIKKKEIKL